MKAKEEEKTKIKALKSKNKLNTKDKVKKIKNQTVSFNLIEVIIIIIVTGLIVSICSGVIVFKNYDSINIKTNNDDTVDTTTIKEFVESYNHIMDSYINQVDGGELIDVAIEAMFKHLEDKYSDYLDEDTTTDLQQRLEGEYEGIGIEITIDESSNIIINRVFENTPAEKAGLQALDIILKVDGEAVEGKSTADVANLIKTNEKSSFEIEYKRKEEILVVSVKRAKINIPSVTSEVLENNIGYIKIDTFSATSHKQMQEELEKLNKKEVTKLIIDVRGNSGGYLSAAKTISEIFIDKGKVLYQLKYKDGAVEKVLSKSKLGKKYEIVVLTNKGSASASEILAAALQESAQAKVVGTQTYGKGTVQEIDKLSSGAMIKYTSAYWLTPSGKSINEIGLTPDIVVEKEADNDNQLEKALEVLKP